MPVLCGAVAAAVCGVLLWFPHIVGLGAVTGIAHLQSFRAPVTAALLLFLALSFVFGRGMRMSAGFIAVSLVFASISLGVVGVRGGNHPAAAPTEADSDVRVLSANMYFDHGSIDDVLGGDARGAQIIALQETHRQTLYDALHERGLADDYRIAHRVHFEGEIGTVLAVHRSLSPTEIPASEVSRGFVGLGTSLGDVYAVHTHAPIERRVHQRQWQRTVSAASQLCEPGTGALAAGDFNATLDHGPFRLHEGCADAARSLRMAGAGTWPSTAPSFIGAQIDHQLYDSAVLTPTAGKFFSIEGSDHRGMVIDYELTGENPA